MTRRPLNLLTLLSLLLCVAAAVAVPWLVGWDGGTAAPPEGRGWDATLQVVAPVARGRDEPARAGDLVHLAIYDLEGPGSSLEGSTVCAGTGGFQSLSRGPHRWPVCRPSRSRITCAASTAIRTTSWSPPETGALPTDC